MFKFPFIFADQVIVFLFLWVNPHTHVIDMTRASIYSIIYYMFSRPHPGQQIQIIWMPILFPDVKNCVDVGMSVKLWRSHTAAWRKNVFVHFAQAAWMSKVFVFTSPTKRKVDTCMAPSIFPQCHPPPFHGSPKPTLQLGFDRLLRPVNPNLTAGWPLEVPTRAASSSGKASPWSRRSWAAPGSPGSSRSGRRAGRGRRVPRRCSNERVFLVGILPVNTTDMWSIVVLYTLRGYRRRKLLELPGSERQHVVRATIGLDFVESNCL